MKVLLLDTGFSSLPIYSYLLERGHDVWVMGNRPHDVLARLAGGRWISQDYSKVEGVRRHFDQIGVDRLVPGCTDVSIKTSAELQGGSKYLDSSETNELLANKQAFRSLCESLDLPSPRALSLDKLPKIGRLICKPVDGFSGHGVTVFDASDTEAARQAIVTAKAASPTQSALVENFVIGQLHSWSVFIENGKVRDSFFVIEGSSIYPFAVDTSFVVQNMPKACESALIEAVEKLAAKLQLVDGLNFIQFLWDGESLAIVEIARRCPGDLYALLVKYSTGYDFAGKYASYFIGEACNTQSTYQKQIVRHTVTSAEQKIFAGLSFKDNLDLHAYYPLASLGDNLLPGHGGRIGLLFCDTPDDAVRETLYNRFLARNAYDVI